ncbi:MAG: hypothetical protein GY731_18360, partial [Gammaproteobacteria bacterium]|nr:hypothetical protein [Gammaproteobacteria bacterium]
SSLKEQELEARKRAQAKAEQQATAKEQAGTGQQAKIEAAKRESLAHKAQELEKKKQRILVAAFAEPGPRGTVNIEQLSMILARSMSSALHAGAPDEVKFKAIVRTLERGDYDKVAKIQGICMELKAGHALTANMNMGWSGKVRDLQLAYIDCSAGRIVKKVSETVTKTRKGWGFRSRTRDFLKQIGLGITQ